MTTEPKIDDAQAARRQALMAKFGVRYFEPGDVTVAEGAVGELYSYECYVGNQEITVHHGDSFCRLVENEAVWTAGPFTCWSPKFGVLMKGYTPPERKAALPERAHLPYVNGCGTAQIFPPLRAGDPTLQWLDIPPHSAEQAHHIHSTARVVYIVAGKGRSIVGLQGAQVIEDLYPGKIIVLDPMCPHHFDTPQGEHLVCVPFHVWSSTPAEFGHPMFVGTHLMDQGA